VNCYACEHPATNACKRCAKPYCEDHGNARYCADCLQPASALPSFRLYNGALLAMLAGTALAVYLILRPPGESSGSSPVIVGRITPAAPGAGQTVAAETPQATAAATRTPGPGATATPSPFRVHVVVEGDTLFSIAEENLSPGDDLAAFTAAIATLNDLDVETAILDVGQSILLPPPPGSSTPVP
jgi:LysM repeat protein